MAVAVCAWPEGSLGLDWMTPWVSSWQTELGCRCECGSRDQNKQSSQSVQSMQAMYPEEGFRYGVEKPAMMSTRRSALVF